MVRFHFTEVDWRKNAVIVELSASLEELLVNGGAILAQYHIQASQPLTECNFEHKALFRKFLQDLAKFANPQWFKQTDFDWDFSKFPSRVPTTEITGLVKVFWTGGAYTSGMGEKKARELELRYRRHFQGSATRLFVYCAVRYDSINETAGGLSYSVEIRALGHISPWFHLVSWDDLILIVNYVSCTLFLIALTDVD